MGLDTRYSSWLIIHRVTLHIQKMLFILTHELMPWRKTGLMRDGQFVQNCQKVAQLMDFPLDHPEFPNQQKGVKQVLQECGLWVGGLLMKCQDKCLVGSIMSEYVFCDPFLNSLFKQFTLVPLHSPSSMLTSSHQD